VNIKSRCCISSIPLRKFNKYKYNTSIRGLPKDWRCCPGRPHHTWLRKFGPWNQTFSRSIMAWTQHCGMPRTEDVGSSSWKWLRSSEGHACDDDDDKYNSFCWHSQSYCSSNRSQVVHVVHGPRLNYGCISVTFVIRANFAFNNFCVHFNLTFTWRIHIIRPDISEVILSVRRLPA